jgi:hypothetical protein
MDSLNASSSLMTQDGHIETLPDDQWVRELWRWQAISLAGLQIYISDYDIGPAVRNPTAAALYERPPREEGGRKLCSMQKMRKAGGFV